MKNLIIISAILLCGCADNYLAATQSFRNFTLGCVDSSIEYSVDTKNSTFVATCTKLKQ